MKKFVIILLLLVNVAAMAQTSNLTVQNLKKGCVEFIDTKDYFKKQVAKGHYNDGTEIEISADDIRDVLELNVVSHFRLKGYDTDLKKELFKETDEYKRYEAELRKFRDEITKKSFCYIHKISNTYNVKEGGFTYEIFIDDEHYFNFAGYINHRTLCIEYATKRFPKNNIEIRKWPGQSTSFSQSALFPVKDKSIALQIEEADRDQVGVLFIFKIDSTKRECPGIWPQTYILTKTESIYIINTQTGEVYCKVL
jgi:hypothetical protein